MFEENFYFFYASKDAKIFTSFMPQKMLVEELY